MMRTEAMYFPLLFALLSPFAPLEAADIVKVEVNTTVKVAEVETSFLSIALDSEMIAKDLKPIPFESQRFITLCNGLSKININRPMIYLRIGGSKGDDVIFKRYGLDVSSEKYVLNSTEWNMINAFAMKMQWKLIFGLNSLERWHDGSWNPSNAIEFLRYTEESGYLVNYELGNEPDLYLGHRNISLLPEQLARDFALLKVVLRDEAHGAPMIFGPDVATLNRDDYFGKFLANIDEGVLDAVTFHFYYGPSEGATTDNFTDPAYMDKFIKYATTANKMVRSGATKETPLWVGETASTYGGGAEGLSDGYVAGFLWLDKLGLAARLNISVVIRQTLLGGNYALLDNDLFPSPDYWISVLHKQLVGHRVLNVTGSTLPLRKTRIYAHCVNEFGNHQYEKGAITIMAINLEPQKDLYFNLTGNMTNLMGEQFLLEPDGVITSKQVALNGNILKLVDDKTLPELKAKTVLQPFHLPPLTYGFFVVPKAKAQACLENSLTYY